MWRRARRRIVRSAVGVMLSDSASFHVRLSRLRLGEDPADGVRIAEQFGVILSLNYYHTGVSS